MTIPQNILDTFKPDACVCLQTRRQGDKKDSRGCLFIEPNLHHNMHVFIDQDQPEAADVPDAWVKLVAAATLIDVTPDEYEQWLSCRSLEEPVHLPFASSIWTKEEREQIGART